MRNIIRSRRLLSLLLCLAMFLSLGFTAYAEPAVGTIEPAQGQIQPVEEASPEAELLPLAPSNEGEKGDFTLEAEPILVENKGFFSFMATMRELTFGPVMWETGDDVGAFLPDKFQLHLYGGEVIDGKGNKIDVLPADSEGQFDFTIIYSRDFVESDPIPMGFPLYGFISSDIWEQAQPGIYSGAYQYRGAWLGKIAGEDDVVYTELRSIPMTVYIPDPNAEYPVVLEQSQGGTLAADKTSAKGGETVTITATPEEGCSLKEIHVTDWTGREVSCRQSGDRWTFTMPLSDVTVTAKWDMGWSALQRLIDQAENGATIELDRDYKAQSGDPALVIPEGKTLTLDLQGHEIDRNLAEATEGGNTLTNNGTLTIKDSGSYGSMKGAFNAGSGGAIINNGTLILEQCTFEENHAKEAAGIYNAEGAVLIINKAQFFQNHATELGGGAIANYGELTVKDADIYNNTTPANGGGIWNAGTLNLTDGSITWNKAANGGGVFFERGTINISGEPAVISNTPNDVYLTAGKRLTVTGPLTGGARIGVQSEESGLPKLITMGLSGNGLRENFVSNDKELRCALNDAGELILIDANFTVEIDSAIHGGTVTADKSSAREGDTVTLTVTPDAGMKLYRLSYIEQDEHTEKSSEKGNDGSWSFKMPAADVIVYATFVPEAEQYSVKVGGVAVTPTNKDNIFGDSGTPRASYDPATATLTLDTPSIPSTGGLASYIYAENQDLVIVAKQPLSIKCLLNATHAINVSGGNLTLKGDITVSAETDHTIEVYGGEGKGNLLIDGSLTAIVTDEYAGSYASFNAQAIHTSGDITITAGSRVDVSSATDKAVYTSNGSVIILGGTVSVSSKKDDGIACRGLSIAGGEVTVQCEESETAIDVDGDVSMTGGILTAKNGKYGMEVSGNMTISGGKLQAAGVRYGITVDGVARIQRGIESVTAEGGTRAFRASGGIILDRVIVQEPQNAVLNTDGDKFVDDSDNDVTRVVLVTDPAALNLHRVILDSSIPEGNVTADVSEAAWGDTVTLTVTDLGGGKLFAEYVNHKFETVSVHDLKQVEGNTWTFTMPEEDVTVSIKYPASVSYPMGRTGVMVLTLSTGDLFGQEGDDYIYAKRGETITATFRLYDYYDVKKISLRRDFGSTAVTLDVPWSYNEAAGVYSADFSMTNAPVTLCLYVDTLHPWKALQAMIDGSEGSKTIVLTKDTVAEADDAAIVVAAGKDIILDLAGFTLDRGLADKQPAANGSVLDVKGALTVKDSSEAKTGLVTGGSNTGSGGGIHNEGVLNLEGGAIRGNATQQWGGGVYLAQNALLNLSGGAIEDNRCVNNGGGIHISESATLNVYGDPAVTGNRKGEDLQNVNLARGTLIHVTGKLENARIGVSVSSNNVPTAESPKPITTGLSGNGTGTNFFSDDEAFYVWVIDGEANLLVQDLSRDINMDGKVNALDLLVLRKKLVDLPVEGSFDPVAADLNKDGNIDILDLVRLRKILGQ